MTLTDLVNKIKNIAESHYLVNTSFAGDIYENFVNNDIKYGAFNVDVENAARGSVGLDVSLYMYYADRLLQDKSNALSIKDDAINVLQSIVNNIKTDSSVIEIGDYTFTPFEQKFDDYLAGAYVRITVKIKSNLSNCSLDVIEREPRVLKVVENGTYDVSGYDSVIVTIPQSNG